MNDDNLLLSIALCNSGAASSFLLHTEINRKDELRDMQRMNLASALLELYRGSFQTDQYQEDVQ